MYHEKTRKGCSVVMGILTLPSVRPMKFATTTSGDNLFIRLCIQRILYLVRDCSQSSEVTITFRLDATSQEIGVTFGDVFNMGVEKDSCAYRILNGVETKKNIDFGDCVVVTYAHFELGALSLDDIQFFLNHDRLRILIVVTNAGVCFSLEKLRSYSKREAIKLFNASIDLLNATTTDKGRLDVAKAFLHRAYSCGINYSVR